MDPGECQALWQIYNATDGPNWQKNGIHPTNWDQGPSCLRVGIRCWFDPDGIGHVTHINFADWKLNGVLPGASFAALPYLEQLSLSKNSLSGVIPTQIAGLPNLKAMSLSDNAFIGIIPEALLGDGDGIYSITPSLGLGGNQLSGGLPQSLGRDKVDIFGVGGNAGLTGPIPHTYIQQGQMELRYDGTQVCEPQDQAMQDWLANHARDPYKTGISCDDATPSPPGIPKNLTASMGTSDLNVIIKWDMVQVSLDHYVLERSMDGTNWSELAKVNNPNNSVLSGVTYYDKNTTPALLYAYRVKACNYNNECSKYSNVGKGVRNFEPPGPIVMETGFQKDYVKLRYVEFRWKDDPLAESYDIYLSRKKGFSSIFKVEDFDKVTTRKKNVYRYLEQSLTDQTYVAFTKNAVAIQACAIVHFAGAEINEICSPAAMHNSSSPGMSSLLQLLLNQ